MVVAAIVGMGLGMTGGIMLGGQIFKNAGEVEEQKFRTFDADADQDEDIPDPVVTGTVTSEYRQVLRHAPRWTTWPDYEQCRWLNDTIKWLWPGLNGAICKQVIEILGPILDDVVAKQPILDAIVVDQLDLGEAPLRLAGIKVYNTKDDEVIMECPIQWGSLMKLHVSACIRAGPASIYIPVKVEDIQLDAVARITMRPLVDKLPCIGAIQISLTDVPFADLTLKLINNWDILSLPFIHDAVMMGIKIGTEPMLVYPNQMDIPLMENSGLAKAPVGMLEVTVEKAMGLKSGDMLGKGDPYISLQVQERVIPSKKEIEEEGGDPDVAYDVRQDEVKTLKEYPTHDTSKKSNTSKPEWNEHFKILIPDVGPAMILSIKVMDYDLIGKDELMGEYEIVLDKKNEEASFLRDSSEAFPLTAHLLPGRKKGATRKTGKARGEVKLSLQYTPFFNPADAEVQDAAGEKGEIDPAKAMEIAARARAARPINDTTKGVLTVDITKCMDLPTGKSGTNSYVQVKMLDPDSPEGPETHNTEVVINEQSPRFRAKFDFVYISATSMLTLTVYEKAGMWDSVLKLGKKEDEMLGKVRIPVKDVVKPGRLKDAFPLQEAEQGDMHLCLTWQSVERDD